MALTDGLIAKYEFDDLSDGIGSYDLTTFDGATVSGGKLNLPSAAGGVYPSSKIPTGDQFTLSLWFENLKDRSLATSNWLQFDGTSTGSPAGSTGTTGVHYIAAIYHDDMLGAFTQAGGWVSSGYSMTNISHSGLHHLVAIYDNGTITYYIDGQQAGNPVAYSPGDGIQVFGSWATHSYAPADSLDGIRVYNRAISLSEVGELYTTQWPSQNTKYTNTDNPEIISSAAPTGVMGMQNTSGDSGFFVYSEKPYTLWLRDSLGSWIAHQTFTSENLVTATTFQWGVNQAAYFQTAESSHDVYVIGRSGALLIDSTPSDGSNAIDSIVLDNGTSLRVFGASSTVTVTESTHAISDGSPVTISDGCDASVVITEVVSDYTDSLSSKMAAYYKFNGNANDSSNDAVHATASSGVVWQSGKLGQGSAFVDSTAVIETNNSNLLDLGPNWTISAWVYVPSSQAFSGDNNSQNNMIIFSNADQYGDWTYMSGVRIMIPKPGYLGGDYLNQPNSLAFESGCGTGNGIYSFAWYASATGTDSFPYDQWVHIAVTMRDQDQPGWGGNEKLYINGTSMPINPRVNQPVQNPQVWATPPEVVRIGGWWAKSQPYAPHNAGDMDFDELAIWKRELSEAEIATLYNAGTGTELDTAYATTETVRNDFTVEKNVVVTAPVGEDSTNIKVKITK